MRNTFSTAKSTIRKVLSFSQLIKNTALSYFISTVLPESLFAAYVIAYVPPSLK